MSKSQIEKIEADLGRWLAASQKIKLSSTLAYAKIKTQLALYETKASKSEITELQSAIGKSYLNSIYNQVLQRVILIFRGQDKQDSSQLHEQHREHL